MPCRAGRVEGPVVDLDPAPATFGAERRAMLQLATGWGIALAHEGHSAHDVELPRREHGERLAERAAFRVGP
jgi:hypothetical protein